MLQNSNDGQRRFVDHKTMHFSRAPAICNRLQWGVIRVFHGERSRFIAKQLNIALMTRSLGREETSDIRRPSSSSGLSWSELDPWGATFCKSNRPRQSPFSVGSMRFRVACSYRTLSLTKFCPFCGTQHLTTGCFDFLYVPFFSGIVFVGSVGLQRMKIRPFNLAHQYVRFQMRY